MNEAERLELLDGNAKLSAENDRLYAELEQVKAQLAAAEQRAAQAEAKAQRWIGSVPVDAIATVIRYTDWNEMPSDESEADWKKVQAWLAALRGGEGEA